MIDQATLRIRFADRTRLHVSDRVVGIMFLLPILALLVEPVLSCASSASGPRNLRRANVKLGVSTQNPAEPVVDSSNFNSVSRLPEGSRPTARPIAAFRFDVIEGNNTEDSSGKSFATTLVNATLTAGRFHKAVELNGINAYVRIDEPGWPKGDYTYAAWVFPRTVSGWRAIVEIQTPESRGMELAIAPGGYIEAWSSGKLRLRNGVPLPALKWTHLAMTRRESLITLFVNGRAQRAGRDSTVFDFGSCPALIGVDSDLGCAGKLNGFFSGVIDELRIYDCALSVGHIRLMMHVPVDRKPN
jgi:hypothetical protein